MSDYKEVYFDEKYDHAPVALPGGPVVLPGGPGLSVGSHNEYNPWKVLFSLSWRQILPGMSMNRDGKILTNNGKILKDVEVVYIFDFWTDSGHCDCIIWQFEVNNKKFNITQGKEALAEFFVNGIGQDTPSTLYIALKWQVGHWPPEVNTANIKIVERTFNEERSLENYMLSKEFRNVIAMNIKDQKVIFSKV